MEGGADMGLGDFGVVIRGRAIGDLFYNCGQPEYERLVACDSGHGE